jgi:hypothetical protein
LREQKGNNISRRMVTFRFDKPVLKPQHDLLKRIKNEELPAIVARCIKAYADLRCRALDGCFWEVAPKKLRDWQGLLSSATNKLHEFLSMDDDDRGISISRVDGCVTWLLQFKAAFEGRMGSTLDTDPSVLAQFGYRVSEKKENVCKACKQLAKSRGGRCCAQYNYNRRRMSSTTWRSLIPRK